MSIHHTFDIDIATELKSAELAILVHHFQYWVSYNSRMNRNFHDGKFWTYSTLKELAEHFPYLSTKQIERLMNKMIDKGILQKGNYNKTPFDRTVWYTFTDNWYARLGKSISRNREMENLESGNPNHEIGTPIPHTKTDTKTNNNKYSSDQKNEDTISRNDDNSSYSHSSFEQRADIYFSSSGKFENITESDLEQWKAAYPDIDIEREIAKAQQWLLAHPSKAKKKLWRKFLIGWFARANDTAENKKAYRSQNVNAKVDRRTRDKYGNPVSSPIDGKF